MSDPLPCQPCGCDGEPYLWANIDGGAFDPDTDFGGLTAYDNGNGDSASYVIGFKRFSPGGRVPVHLVFTVTETSFFGYEGEVDYLLTIPASSQIGYFTLEATSFTGNAFNITGLVITYGKAPA